MDAAVAVLGGLVLLAAAARLLAALLRRLRAGSLRAGRRAASAGRAVGGRGLLAALAGTSSSLAAAAGAHAAPAAAAPPVAAPAAAPHAPSTYVVRAGDCLWTIAARHLGPGAGDAAIAAEWPRWYRANRTAIGSDPSLLRIGTRLAVPSPRRTGTSASHHPRPAHHGPGRSALSLDPDRR